MWYLFTVRVSNRLKQFCVQGDSYDSAEANLKELPKLEKYVFEWGMGAWILSCWSTESEPKEI